MQATAGTAVSHRARGRLMGCLVALAMALAVVVAAPATASAERKVTTYLGLGESATFGFNKVAFEGNYPNESPSFFEEGFGNFFRIDLNKANEVGAGVTFVNDGCPNETSDGLIGHNLLGGGPGPEFDPCPYHNTDGFPLHNSLGSASQLEDALSILKEGHPVHPVDAITVEVGMSEVNDAIAKCQAEFPGEEEAVQRCWDTTAPNVTEPEIIENVEAILGTLDSTEPGGGHYGGPIVLVGLYNPYTFVVKGSDSLTVGLDKALETEVASKFPNVTFANPLATFNKGLNGSTTEKKALCTETEMCEHGDPDTSGKGARALAKIVNAAYLVNPAH